MKSDRFISKFKQIKDYEKREEWARIREAIEQPLGIRAIRKNELLQRIQLLYFDTDT